MSENNQPKKQLFVFYSWQSDLGHPHTSFLREAIKQACLQIEENNEFSIIVDDATRDMSGSGDIVKNIFDKVKNADIFIGDITIINNSDNVGNRPVPNPNVMIELGYALAHLGEDRIIMPFNTFYGKMADRPFDIITNRCLDYKYDFNPERDKNYRTSGKSDLTKNLFQAIKLIFIKNPQKPRDSEFNPDKIKQERDIKQIKNLLSKINLDILDEHINLDNSPFRIWHGIFGFQHDFNSILISSSFHLHDKKLWELLKEINKQWEITLSFGDYYQSQPPSEYYYFDGQEHLPDKVDQDCLKIKNASLTLKTYLKELSTYIHEKYLEIDLQETNQKALNDYILTQKEIEKTFGSKQKLES